MVAAVDVVDDPGEDDRPSLQNGFEATTIVRWLIKEDR